LSLEKNTIGVLRLSALGDAVLVVPMIHDLINALRAADTSSLKKSIALGLL
jgi:ADP-heptose:LPS heptosyltransferase